MSAGSGELGYSGDGGPSTKTALNLPMGLAVDGEGNVFFAEHHNNMVRKVNRDGTITAIAGTGEQNFNSDEEGLATKVPLNQPWGQFLDKDAGVSTSPTHSTPESGQFIWRAHE